MLAPNTSQVAMLWNDTNTGMVLRAREAQDALELSSRVR
jgi:hypothetical protein